MNVAANVMPSLLLSELLLDIAAVEIDITVSGLTLNSTETQPGDIFIALPGALCHGLEFVSEAIRKGASAVLYDGAGATSAEFEGIRYVNAIAIDNLAEKLGQISARFYGFPAQQLQIVGITGTNGKTSCSQFLGQVLEACSIIGTLGYGQWAHLTPTINTTPDALTLQKVLAAMVDQKQAYVAMEVSSHGLVQGRVNAIDFTGAVITNISRDHLDYHGSMTAYVQAKARILATPSLRYVVVNLDDDYCQEILAAVPDSVAIWGISQCGRTLGVDATLQAENISCEADGVRFDVLYKQQRLVANAAVYGKFNVENLLVILAVLLASGITIEKAVKRIASIQSIAGRMESFNFGKHATKVFVDYAHTPNALENVLISARAYCQQKLWLVFGCGGDRDQGKRALMGGVAEQYADQIIITDDNPRNEDAVEIVNDILSGCSHSAIQVIHNRETAIKSVIAQAGPNDCVVIAGKGHETYQEIAGHRTKFSDRKLLKELILEHRESL